MVKSHTFFALQIIQGALLNAESSRASNDLDSLSDHKENSNEGTKASAELGDHVYLLIYELHTLQVRSANNFSFERHVNVFLLRAVFAWLRNERSLIIRLPSG